MKGLLFNLIKLCRFSKNEADAGQFPVQQVEYLEKAGDSFVVLPYGVHANIPADFLGLLLSAQEQNRFVLPLSAKERPHPVASGEIVVFHPVTGSKIHFKNNGDIDITAPNVNYSGNVAIAGNLTVAGATALNTLTVSGLAEFNGGIESNGTSIDDSHAHSGVSTGPSNTGGVV